MGEEKKTVYALMRQAGLLVMVPFALGLGPALGFFLGDYLDRRWGTDPWLMIAFLLLGAAAGVRQTMALIRAAMQQ